MSWVAIVVLGCCAVLALDTVGALVARRGTFNYLLLAPLSLLLYAGTGFLAASAAEEWLAGAVGGAAAAAVDATVGWRIGRMLGVEDPVRVTDRVEIGTAATVTVTGAVLGGLAGLIA